MGLLLIWLNNLLGMHLDQDLDVDIQTEYLCRSLSTKIGFLKHIGPFLKRPHKVLYYNAVLKLSFLYGSSVWSSTSKARLILNAPFNANYTLLCFCHISSFGSSLFPSKNQISSFTTSKVKQIKGSYLEQT